MTSGEWAGLGESARRLAGWALAFAALLVVGCASSGSPDDGTLVIGEVTRVLTRAQVAAGDLAPGEHRDELAEWVREHGLSDADVDAGRAIVFRRGIYWYNTTSGVKYSMATLARVEQGLTVEVDNIIELRVVGAEGLAVVQRVRAASRIDGACFYQEIPPNLVEGVVGTIGLTGSRGLATLYCQGLRSEGWQQPHQFWVRPPGAPAPAPGASEERASGSERREVFPPSPAETPTSALRPAPQPLKDHALLLLFRNDIGYGSWFDVPFWVDGEKVLDLPRKHCDLVLLNPGEHVVAAGSGNSLQGARREVTLVVQAGETVVVEYFINNTSQTQWGLAEFFSAEKRAQAMQAGWSIVDRRAMPSDRCETGLYKPRVVGRPAVAASAPPP